MISILPSIVNVKHSIYEARDAVLEDISGGGYCEKYAFLITPPIL